MFPIMLIILIIMITLTFSNMKDGVDESIIAANYAFAAATFG